MVEDPKYQEFQLDKYRHRFAVDPNRTIEQEAAQSDYEWWKFRKYIDDHESDRILV